jgi:hypothetical protein
MYNKSMGNVSNNAIKTRGRPFAPGNKHGQGRPAGSRNKATLALEALIDGQGEEVVSTIIEEAKNGNMVAAKALLDRLVPPRKSSPTPLDVPCIRNPDDLGAALYKVANDMASGALTPDEAQAITGVIANHIKLHETINIEKRLANLETALGDANTTS